MRPEDVIIDQPTAMRLPHRLTNIGLTMVFWGLLLWLWQPLLTLGLWYINSMITYDHMVVLGGWRPFIETSLVYMGVVSLQCGALIGWARLQQWRFRGKEKRGRPAELDNNSVAKWFGTHPFARRHWMRLRTMNVYFNEDNHELRIRPTNMESEEEGMDHIYTAPIVKLEIAHEELGDDASYDDYRH